MKKKKKQLKVVKTPRILALYKKIQFSIYKKLEKEFGPEIKKAKKKNIKRK